MVQPSKTTSATKFPISMRTNKIWTKNTSTDTRRYRTAPRCSRKTRGPTNSWQCLIVLPVSRPYKPHGTLQYSKRSVEIYHFNKKSIQATLGLPRYKSRRDNQILCLRHAFEHPFGCVVPVGKKCKN